MFRLPCTHFNILLSPQTCMPAVVSLGSALFTINSTFAFASGPMVSICVMNITHRKSEINASKLNLQLFRDGMHLVYLQQFHLESVSSGLVSL